MFTRLKKPGLKVNVSKSCFGAHKFDYFGYHVTRDGVMPIPKKVESIQALTAQKSRKKLCQFIRMINFYRDMRQKRSEILAPLNALTSKKVKCDWKDEHQRCFDAITRVIGSDVLLAYLDFNAPFEIHTDAFKLQIGAVISQKGNTIAFYSRKMNSAQKNYTTTEKEILSIVSSLKEFCTILLGHHIMVYTDHKNLTYILQIQAPFEIHTDAFKLQIGAVISQKGNTIAFYSRKMNSAQKNYTTTEKEILSIVSSLKEFCTILLGHHIMVYTDHKNLTYILQIQNA